MGAWLQQFIVSVILLWGMGLIALQFLLPEAYRREALLIAPFFGLAVISSVSHYLGALGLTIRQFGWGLLVAMIVIGGFLLLRSKLKLDGRACWKIALICLAVYMLAMLPLLKLGYLTTIGTTIDGLSYAVRSEYLQESAPVRPDVPPGQPFYGWVASQIELLRIGDVYFVGLVGFLSGLRSYQLLTALAALFFALMPASVYVLARRTFHIKETAALLAAGLCGLHNLLLWAVYDNFLSQTIAMSLFPLLVSFEIEALRTLRVRETAGFALLLAALFSLYPVYVLPVLAVAVLYAGWSAVREVQRTRRLWPVARRYLVWGAMLLIVVLISNGIAAWRSLNELDFIGKLLDPQKAGAVGAGNILVFPPIFEVLGLISHAAAAYGLGVWQLSLTALTAVSGVLGIVMVVGWFRWDWDDRLTALILLAVTAGMALQQRFLVNMPNGYPYGYFKAISLVALVGLIFSAQGFMVLMESARWRYAGALLAVGIIGLNGFNTGWLIRYISRERVLITRDVIEIPQALANVPDDEWVLLDLQPGLTQHWIGYLLKGQRIHYREPLFTQHVYDHVVSEPHYQYALVERSMDDVRRQQGVLDEPWYNPQSYAVLWGNSVYELRQRTDAVLAGVQIPVAGSCWHAGEFLHITFTPDQQIQVRIGDGRSFAGAWSGDPQSVQLTLAVFTETVRLRYADTPLELTPGVWTVNLAVHDLGELALENTSGSAWVHKAEALATNRGDPGRAVEAAQRLDGVAFVKQTGQDAQLQYDVILVRPQNDLFTYRLGIHIFDPKSGKIFGVWGLDFGDGERVQSGLLRLDLVSRAAEGSVNGAVVEPGRSHFDVESGDFEVQVVWWKLGISSYLSLYPSANFSRDGAGQVRLTTSVDTSMTILPAP